MFDSPNKERLQALLKKIIKIITDKGVKDIESKMFKDLLVSYLNFVAQSKHENDEERITEEQLITHLELHREIWTIQLQKIDPDKSVENKKVTYKLVNNRVLKEINYILLWLYRRNRRIDEGIELSKSFGPEVFKDPRFCHGVGVLYVSKLYKEIKEKQLFNMDDALRAYNYLLKAKENYIDWIMGKHRFGLIRKLIHKNIIAVYNLLADLKVRMAEHSPLAEINIHLKLAKEHIKSAKMHFRSIELKYENSATYNTTEIEIQLVEIKHLRDLKNYQKALEIIKEAEIKEKLVTGLSYYKMYVQEFFQNKIKELDKLRMEINALDLQQTEKQVDE